MFSEIVLPVQIILAKPGDWPEWLKQLEGHARVLEVWQYINPSLAAYDGEALSRLPKEERDSKAASMVKELPKLPKEPEYPEEFDERGVEIPDYEAVCARYDRAMARYTRLEAQQKELKELFIALHIYIMSSVKMEFMTQAVTMDGLYLKIQAIKHATAFTDELNELKTFTSALPYLRRRVKKRNKRSRT
jgi:hypothetical protein